MSAEVPGSGEQLEPESGNLPKLANGVPREEEMRTCHDNVLDYSNKIFLNLSHRHELDECTFLPRSRNVASRFSRIGIHFTTQL